MRIPDDPDPNHRHTIFGINNVGSTLYHGLPSITEYRMKMLPMPIPKICVSPWKESSIDPDPVPINQSPVQPSAVTGTGMDETTGASHKK